MGCMLFRGHSHLATTFGRNANCRRNRYLYHAELDPSFRRSFYRPQRQTYSREPPLALDFHPWSSSALWIVWRMTKMVKNFAIFNVDAKTRSPTAFQRNYGDGIGADQPRAGIKRQINSVSAFPSGYFLFHCFFIYNDSYRLRETYFSEISKSALIAPIND